MQRLRIRFGRSEKVKFISHLDLMRLWERALRRSNLSLVYSEGFSPHPRISMAAPLPVGVTSEDELMDVFLSNWISPNSFMDQVGNQLPDNVTMVEVWPVGLNEPSLQSRVRFAEYKVAVETDRGIQEVKSALKSLLSASELPWQHFRDTGIRNYDLRVLVDDLWFIDLEDFICTVGMRLTCGSQSTGRPEQVARALGFSRNPRLIHRTRLIFN